MQKHDCFCKAAKWCSGLLISMSSFQTGWLFHVLLSVRTRVRSAVDMLLQFAMRLLILKIPGLQSGGSPHRSEHWTRHLVSAAPLYLRSYCPAPIYCRSDYYRESLKGNRSRIIGARYPEVCLFCHAHPNSIASWELKTVNIGLARSRKRLGGHYGSSSRAARLFMIARGISAHLICVALLKVPSIHLPEHRIELANVQISDSCDRCRGVYRHARDATFIGGRSTGRGLG